jgi:hypothetical protein
MAVASSPPIFTGRIATADRYTTAQTFQPTYSGANIHRWAIILIIHMNLK